VLAVGWTMTKHAAAAAAVNGQLQPVVAME